MQLNIFMLFSFPWHDSNLQKRNTDNFTKRERERHIVSVLESKLFYSHKNQTSKQTILVGSMSILFQFIQKAHFEQMAHKEILMCCLVQMISMRFNVSSLMMIIILSQIIKRILQPEKNIKYNKAQPESCHLCMHYPERTNMHFLCSLMGLPWQWFQYLLQLL